jgi:hypothetical protein
MEQLDDKIGVKTTFNNQPCEIFVTKLDESTYGLALSVDHGDPFGQVYYQNIAGGYGSSVDAETALQDIIDNIKGGLDLSEGWKPVSKRPLALARLDEVNESKETDWRKRESRELLKTIASLGD